MSVPAPSGTRVLSAYHTPRLTSELPRDPGAVTDTEPEAGRAPVTRLRSWAVEAGLDLGFFDTRAHNTLKPMNNC